MENWEELLGRIQSELSFGHETIRLSHPYAVPALQVGYSVSPTGFPLSDDKTGGWRKEWTVIGYAELCGDPIFIDSSDERFPVYTAIHGDGDWEPSPIAVSLGSFGRALSAVANIARGRENPAALEANPLTAAEREATLDAIQRDNPGLDLAFWELLLTQD